MPKLVPLALTNFCHKFEVHHNVTQLYYDYLLHNQQIHSYGNYKDIETWYASQVPTITEYEYNQLIDVNTKGETNETITKEQTTTSQSTRLVSQQ